MENLGSFIPMDRRQAMANSRTLAERGMGAALFADVSGFTPLTEALVREYGPQRGAEEITANLNRVYDALITQIHHYGGSVIMFVGDAVTCWFPEDDGSRSAAAGLAMQAAMERVSTIHISAGNTVTLSIKIAVTAGQVRRFQVGDPEHYFIDVIAGSPLNRLADIEQHTQRGQVLMDADTARALSQTLDAQPVVLDEKEYALVRSLKREVAPAPWATLAPGALPDEQARPWVIPVVYHRLRAGQGEFLSELRTAVPLFCKFDGIDYDTDPEAGAKLDAYVRWVQQVAGRYGGELLSVTIGDKGSFLYVNFGALVAHDDDVLRALAVAMELRRVPEALAFIQNIKIGVSIGRIRAGAYGSDAQRVYGAIGDETNVAARLMEYASPGQIVVSQRIAQVGRHRYEFRELGRISIKGKEEELELFELGELRAGDVHVGGVSTSERRHSRMVGREQERAQLRAALERLSRERRGGTIIIQGEAGIGKSRLVQDLSDEAERGEVSVLIGAGDAIEQTSLYFAWKPVFAHLLGIHQVPAETDALLAQVRGWLETHAPELLQRAALLSVVLPFDIPDNEVTGILGGHERAEAARELLTQVLQTAAASSPLMVILEDAHWLDSPSWALAQRVSAGAPSLLFALATRPLSEPLPPEFAAISGSPVTAHLPIGPLPGGDVTLLLRERLQVHSIPDSVADFIRTKSEGNPFFSEELLYALRDSGVLAIHDHACTLAPNAPALDDLNFPDTVEGVVTSRIDRLTPSQQLAIKVASVIGRVFAYRVLYQIHPASDELPRLDTDLKTISRLDLTPLETPDPELRYMFKHIITQEVSYGLLLFAQRQRLHRAVGEWYEENHAADLSPFYPLLAHHWTRTVQAPPIEPDALQKAIDYSFKAGEQALRNDALLESLGHFTRALELIKTLPESPMRDGMELGAQVLRAVPLMLTRGWANPDVGAAYERAHELTKRLGETPQMFLALSGVFTYYLVRGNLAQARELSEVNLGVAEKSGDPELILEASQDIGAAHFYTGHIEESLPHFARVGELYIPEKHHYHVFAYGRNPLAVALQHESLAWWYLGFPEKSLAYSDTGMNLTAQWHHPFSRAWVLISRCLTLHLLGDVQGMQAAAQEAIGLAAAQGFPNWLAQGLVHLGWSIAAQGNPEEGIAKIKEGLGIWRMTGSVLVTPVFLYMLADAHSRLGEAGEARAVIQEALTLINQTGERVWEPEIRRFLGDLCLSESPAEAGEHFQRALEQSRAQKARSNELRAAMSLAKLWHSQGKIKEGRDLLKPIYDSFTEGFSTSDLTKARQLLDQLEN